MLYTDSIDAERYSGSSGCNKRGWFTVTSLELSTKGEGVFVARDETLFTDSIDAGSSSSLELSTTVGGIFGGEEMLLTDSTDAGSSSSLAPTSNL